MKPSAEERGDLVITALAEGVAAEGATNDADRDRHLSRAAEALDALAEVPDP